MLIAGVDEAGRGPLAGPVVAAAVILHPDKPILGLADSKQLTAKKREYLFDIICENALAFSLGRAEPAEIDKLNILQATLLSMRRAVEGLKIAPEAVWIDGNRCPSTAYLMKAIIGGDRLVPAISAASILAKVTRDREMLAMDALYPKYGFMQHKGYPTALHRDKLKKYGPSPIHRLSFGPVAALLSGTAHE